ncbi:hypothetical protein AB0D12_29915 [Streptomyces sp. NPDC048479]|uniref:hypothetical protein n=1 Tax=Streptomyces sp. NPDC048479 TaxID=3154725 RepID=UPI0034412841
MNPSRGYWLDLLPQLPPAPALPSAPRPAGAEGSWSIEKQVYVLASERRWRVEERERAAGADRSITAPNASPLSGIRRVADYGSTDAAS